MLVPSSNIGAADSKNTRKNKVFLSWVICMLISCVPRQHHAQTFADSEMLKRLSQQYSIQASRRGEALNRLLEQLADKDVSQKLTEVNRFFNQFVYMDDKKLWGQQDYWATPEEFIGSNGGDCEDYVIAKYYVLRSLGVADENLYLTYVKAISENRAHMVLSYFETPKSTPLILDNYNPRILPADKRRDLLPVYSFNAKSLFLTNASAGLG
ncbi:MAG: transglutaminase-like cysteine peptidase, partial [Gammaproteobacteria bacterium]